MGAGTTLRKLLARISPGPVALSAIPTPTLSAVAGSTSVALTAAYTGPPTFSTFTFYQIVNNSWTTLATQTSGSFNVTGLTSGVLVYFGVVANVAGGRSSARAITSTTPHVSVPSQVTGLTVTATTSSTVSLSWTSAANATTYTVERNGTVIASGLTATMYVDTGLAASSTFTYNVAGVNVAGTGAFSAPVSGTTSSAGGSTTLLAFTQGLAAKQAAAQPYFLWGQHTNYYQQPNSVPGALNVFSGGTTPQTAYYQGSGGRYQPAIMCFGLQGPFNGDVNNTQQHGVNGCDTASLANAFLAAGGIPFLSMWPINPASTSSQNGEGDFSVNPWPAIITPGTAVYNSWHSNLATLSAIVNNINGPVYLRPFVELNLGGSFWYAPQNQFGVTNAQFITLWQQTRTAFMAGITNPKTEVVWVYNINSGVGNYVGPFPGTGPTGAQVLGYDIYFDLPGTGMVSDGVYADFLAIGLPMMICEGGNGGANQPSDNGPYPVALQDMKTKTPKVFAYLVYPSYQPPLTNTAAQVTTLMTDAALINLPQLPGGL